MSSVSNSGRSISVNFFKVKFEDKECNQMIFVELRLSCFCEGWDSVLNATQY